MRVRTILAVALASTFLASVSAQKPTPTPQMDSRGLPLPFGVQPVLQA